jgi:putative tryptophan/tyrosine transport system substrate-binding protein
VTVASQQAARVEAFKLGLKELGYIEGRNIKTEYRYAEGKLDRLPSLAEELVGLKVDVIVTGVHKQRVPQKKRLIPYLSSRQPTAILSEMDSSRASRDLEGTSLDCQPSPPR